MHPAHLGCPQVPRPRRPAVHQSFSHHCSDAGRPAELPAGDQWRHRAPEDRSCTQSRNHPRAARLTAESWRMLWGLSRKGKPGSSQPVGRCSLLNSPSHSSTPYGAAGGQPEASTRGLAERSHPSPAPCHGSGPQIMARAMGSSS